MHQRAGLNLPSSKPSGSPGRSTVLRAWGRRSGPRSRAHSTARQRALLRSHRGLRRIQTHNQKKEIKALSLSSNRKQLRYGYRGNIFWRFSNGSSKIMLGVAW